MAQAEPKAHWWTVGAIQSLCQGLIHFALEVTFGADDARNLRLEETVALPTLFCDDDDGGDYEDDDINGYYGDMGYKEVARMPTAFYDDDGDDDSYGDDGDGHDNNIYKEAVGIPAVLLR